MMKLPTQVRGLPSEHRVKDENRRISPRLAFWGAAVLLILPAVSLAAADQAARYPFDPACPWGRLSNGKGMFHRCITEGEARELAEASKKKPEKEERKKPAPSKDDAKDARTLPKGYELSIGPIEADEGEITIGRLDLPMDRYRECIDRNGGLTGKTGKVVVKFLVRAERVRAEGVSVDGYEKVSEAAAECIASVVDRRQVGVPSVPLTAARLTFLLQEKR